MDHGKRTCRKRRRKKRIPEILESRKDAKDIEAYRGGFGTGSTKEGRIGKKRTTTGKGCKVDRKQIGNSPIWEDGNKQNSGMAGMERAEEMGEQSGMQVAPKGTLGKQARPGGNHHKIKNDGERSEKWIFGTGTQE